MPRERSQGALTPSTITGTSVTHAGPRNKTSEVPLSKKISYHHDSHFVQALQ